MAAKRHLKRIAAPKSWELSRKEAKFTIRPRPGAHKLTEGMALGLILKELTKHAKTTKEAKKILLNKTVLVDGKRKRDHRQAAGLMDVIEFPELKEAYRLIINKKGKIELISAKEKDLKLCKIVSKRADGKQFKLGLNDGKNLTVKENSYKTGDSVLITLPKQEIKQHLKLEKDAMVYLTGGTYVGEQGTLESIKEDRIILKAGKGQIETSKKFAFVIGKADKAAITLKE